MADKLNIAVYSPYGAYELKAKYQRNMFMGTMTSALLVLLVLIFAYAYKAITAAGDAVNVAPVIIKTVADLGPPPTVSKPKPRVEITTPTKAAPKVGIPKPVASDELIDEDVVIASREELAEIVAPDVATTIDDAGSDIIVDIPEEDYMPAPDEFVPLEIFPEMIAEHPPEYPRLAKQAGLEGTVWVQALVDKDGNVRDARVYKESGTNAGFEEAAVEAAFKCKFSPGIQNGRPVAAWVAYEVEFKLRDQ